MYSIPDRLLLLIPEQVLLDNKGNSILHHKRDRVDHRTQDPFQQIWYLPLDWMEIRHGDHQLGEVVIHYHQEEAVGLLV